MVAESIVVSGQSIRVRTETVGEGVRLRDAHHLRQADDDERQSPEQNGRRPAPDKPWHQAPQNESEQK